MTFVKVVFLFGLVALGCSLFYLLPESNNQPAVAQKKGVQRTSGPKTSWPMYRQKRKLSGRVKHIPSAFKKAWHFQGKSTFRASAILSQREVFCADNKGNLYCLLRENGTLLWSIKLDGPVTAEPLFIGSSKGGRLFIGTSRGQLRAVDVKSGKTLWQKSYEDKISAGCSFYRNGDKTYVLLSCHDGFLYSLLSTDGSLAWKVDVGEPVNATPAVEDGTIVFGCCDGKLRFVSTEGKEVRRMSLGSYLPSSPAIDDGVVYATTHDGLLIAIDLKSGKKLWTFSDERVEDFFAPPAIGDSTVVAVDKRGNVFIIDKSKGGLLKMFTLSGDVSSEPLVDRNSLLIGDKDGALYCFSLVSGKEPWKLNLGSPILAPLTLCDWELYVGDKDGFLTLYQGGTSE